ncbi:MAG: FHA domain-containing protein [Thermoguttaceae bacterium]|jgi:enamine deaminase RidA (YjgF/YER057c/UK114 family)
MPQDKQTSQDRIAGTAESDVDKGRLQRDLSDKTVCSSASGKKKKVLARSGKLSVLNGPLQGREFVLGEGDYRIGSSADNDFVIRDPTVSRRHCHIRLTPPGYLIRDLASTNGTFVNGVKVAEAFLDYGDELYLGETGLVFRSLKDAGECMPIRGTPAGKRLDGSLAIQKFSRHGIGYSLAEWSDVRHVFAAAVPRRGATLAAQADDALRTIEAVNGVHGTQGAIVHQAVFLPDPALIDECRAIMREFYRDDLPATSYVAQPPCDGKLIAIEAMGLGTGRGDVEIHRISEQLVIARHNGIAWTHAALVAPQTTARGAYDQGMCAFRQLQTLLAGANMRMDQVVRTWLYQGGIVADEGATQRYKELNRARTDFYEGIPFLRDRLPKGHPPTVYPASTGIGTEGRGLEASAIALATDRPEVLVAPLENPRQNSAYSYSAAYSPKSPKFSRAMAVTCGRYAMIFISGTASITDSETRHVGDAAAQTRETLDNIAALISEENLSRHGLSGLGTSLAGIGLARVYIKRKEDYQRVRAVCEERLGELPTIYAVADVCRPDLLVEIEGVALSCNANALAAAK